MTTLADASEARKERLIALRQRKLGQQPEGVNSSKEPFRFRQRNFDPETRTLRRHAKAGEEEDTVEKQIAGVAEQIIAEDEERRKQDLDLFNIAPKRPNWDLKRDMEKKLAKLERKTAEAIHALIRKRMAATQGTPDDLSAQIRAQQQDVERATAADDKDDDDEEAT
ncbi:hypothetical protein FRB94_011777 [Tulasnella sp. JGI-2019a]|nr:hypothetical protein FRB93_002224 [Tulasnella sp. JGI-2019a]KAG9014599.1 hypothetical protein FRB94_011777 [Tulasnella sp. JGI-2019a]KAG9038934.1 hypothetical protein FRB95_013612 [Tulasnella sp. JGI-2019a]